MKNLLFIFTLIFLSNILDAQTYSGTIQDEDNLGLPGVSILVQNTSNGTITDIDGHFELNAQPGDVIEISFIGYLNQVITLNDANHVLNINLEPNTVLIDEIVVMGYSSKAKTEISSAVVVLDNSELNDVAATDVGTLLQGKVSGVQVINSSGEPGSGAQVRIRGVSTIKPGNAEPLYVVDGIIGGNFDPNDVESISVLKDAGATGLYGTRANKGVIIVTTKKAKLGKSSLEFISSYGYNVADHGNIQMMSGDQFYNDFSAEFYRDPDLHTIDKIKFYKDYPKELAARNFNWVDEIFQPASVQKYYLGASGRNDKVGYYLSGTIFDEGGTYRGTGFKKINLRANTDVQVSKRLKVKNNINISTSQGSSYDYLDLYYAYLSIPWDNGYDADGAPVYVDSRNHDWWSRDHINPLHSIDNSEYSYKGMDLNYDLIGSFRIFDWLSFSSSNRLSLNTTKNHRFVSLLAAGTNHGKGFISENQKHWYGGISTNLFRFDHSFGSHSFDGLMGGEFEKGQGGFLAAQGKNLPEGFDVLTTASAEKQIDGFTTEEIMRSFISQVNYNFDHTYFLTASYRIDASSNFAPNHRVAHFPSVSASWLMDKMSFVENSSLLNRLKLRSSFGITADSDIGAGRYLGLYALNTQYNGNPAATPKQLANPDLTWERTNQLNFGIDVGLFKNDRISFALDLYNNVTNDLIVKVSQPLSQGFEDRWENAGSVTNKGIELALSTDIIQRKNFTWTTDINFSKNINKLSGIGNPIYTTVGGITQIYRDDIEIYTFLLPKWLGIDPDTGGPLWEKIEKDDQGNITSRTSTSNYSEADPQEVGHALPSFSGGVGTSLQYKGISLFANFAYQYGNDIYNATRVFMDNDGQEPYYNNLVPNPDWSRWEKPGDVATHPSFQNNALSKEPSSRYLEDGSFIKLRTVNLNYTLPSSWIQKLHLQACTIGVSADNLYTMTNFWGQDPEVTLNQLAWSMPGVSDFKYPNNKRFMVNLNLKF